MPSLTGCIMNENSLPQSRQNQSNLYSMLSATAYPTGSALASSHPRGVDEVWKAQPCGRRHLDRPRSKHWSKQYSPVHHRISTCLQPDWIWSHFPRRIDPFFRSLLAGGCDAWWPLDIESGHSLTSNKLISQATFSRSRHNGNRHRCND